MHLFLGCFFAPMLLFYAATGWYQTVRTDRTKKAAEAETWVSKMTAVHKDQIYPTESAMSYSTKAFKGLVVLMCIAFMATISLGIYLAFKMLRQQWLVWISLLTGIAVPVLVLWLSQKR
jgi:hypothetical protein